MLEKENGLRALLALTGFSNETLKILITLIRVVDDPELSKLVNKTEWIIEKDNSNISEWTDDQITKFIKENHSFRKGIVNIFFEGSTNFS